MFDLLILFSTIFASWNYFSAYMIHDNWQKLSNISAHKICMEWKYSLNHNVQVLTNLGNDGCNGGPIFSFLSVVCRCTRKKMKTELKCLCLFLLVKTYTLLQMFAPYCSCMRLSSPDPRRMGHNRCKLYWCSLGNAGSILK